MIDYPRLLQKLTLGVFSFGLRWQRVRYLIFICCFPEYQTFLYIPTFNHCDKTRRRCFAS